MRAAFMPFGADHIKATGFERFLLLGFDVGLDLGDPFFAFLALHFFRNFLSDAHVQITAELNIGTTTSHVGRYGNGPRRACLSHDDGFLFVEAGVQNLMRDLFFP